jgi:hypothetical protein
MKHLKLLGPCLAAAFALSALGRRQARGPKKKTPRGEYVKKEKAKKQNGKTAPAPKGLRREN